MAKLVLRFVACGITHRFVVIFLVVYFSAGIRFNNGGLAAGSTAANAEWDECNEQNENELEFGHGLLRRFVKGGFYWVDHLHNRTA